MNEDKDNLISKDFIKRFDRKFFDIAKYADKGNVEGYGKGLARLETEIEEYIIKTISQSNKALLTKLREEIEELRHELGQEKSLGGVNEVWKEGHTKCLEEVIALIDKYLEHI